MIKRTVLAATSLLMLSLAACSASSDSASTGGEQDIKEGQTCGGVAGLRCSKGLTCELSSNAPDASGKCVKEPTAGTEGGMCGGIAGVQCKSGLVCDLSTGPRPGTQPPTPPPGSVGMPIEAIGTCVKGPSTQGAGQGEACGGVAGIQCQAGLSCVTPSTCCDQMGTCQK
jgi:hypothetical protein